MILPSFNTSVSSAILNLLNIIVGCDDVDPAEDIGFVINENRRCPEFPYNARELWIIND